MQVNCVNCGQSFRTLDAYDAHWCEEMGGDPSDFGDGNDDSDGRRLVADGSGHDVQTQTSAGEWYLTEKRNCAHRRRDCSHLANTEPVDTITREELDDTVHIRRCSICGPIAPTLGDD